MKQILLILVLLLVTVFLHSQQIVTAEILLKDGDILDTSTVEKLRGLSVNLEGEVAIGFELANNVAGLWSAGNVLHLNSDFSLNLSGIESTLGLGSNGNYIISPSVDEDDSVFGDNGLILAENTQAPGFPAGVTSTFNSRPQMFGKDNAYWISGINFSGGTTTEDRVFYTQKNLGLILPITTEGVTTVDGIIIDNIGFNFDVSDNDIFSINVLFKDTGSSLDDATLVLNGTTSVAQENSPSGIAGANWDSFDFLAINNEGDYIFTGDTDGSSLTDEFFALNGLIQFQEGDVIDGITLTSPMTFDGISLNNFGKIVFVVSYNGVETLFESDVNDITGNANSIMTTGDLLDTNDDGIGDFVVDDFNAGLFPDLDLSDHNYIFLELDITPISGGTTVEALVKIPISCPNIINLSNVNGDINHDIPVFAKANVINAANVIGSTSNVTYDASIEINFEPGFETTLGATFEVLTNGCP